jgi:hypothetical protein
MQLLSRASYRDSMIAAVLSATLSRKSGSFRNTSPELYIKLKSIIRYRDLRGHLQTSVA